MLENESLTQNVKSPTFQRADGQINNTLDLIISDTPERISELAFTAPLGKTKLGHLCLTWNYHLSQPIKQERTSSIKFALKKGNYDKINQKFNDQNCDELFNHKTTNECYNLFQEIAINNTNPSINFISIGGDSTNINENSIKNYGKLLQI